MDDVAQGLIRFRVVPVQFLFRDHWIGRPLWEGPGSAPPKEGESSLWAPVDPVDNFEETLLIGAIAMVTVGAPPDRPLACGTDTRLVRDPSRPIGPV